MIESALMGSLILLVLAVVLLESRLPRGEYGAIEPLPGNHRPLDWRALEAGTRSATLAPETFPARCPVEVPDRTRIAMRSLRIRGPFQGLRIAPTDGVDFGSVDSVVHDVTAGLGSDQAKAEALWRFVMSATVHGPDPFESTRGNFSPLHHLTSYGYSRCGNATSTLAHLWERAGLSARTWSLRGHVAPEVRYGGAWHLYDPDERLVFRDPGSGAVLGITDLLRSPESVKFALDPHGRGPRGHRAERLRAIYTTRPVLDDYYRVKERWLERGDLGRLRARPTYAFDLYRYLRLHRRRAPESAGIRLREGEEMRLFWTGEPSRSALPSPDCLRDTRPGGSGIRRLPPRHANGCILSRPVRTGALEGDAAWQDDGTLTLRPGSRRGGLRWSLASPFLITNAAVRGRWAAGSGGRVRLDVRAAGVNRWSPAGACRPDEPGFVMDLGALNGTDAPRAVYAYRLRMRLEGRDGGPPPRVEELEVQTDIQLNPAALPGLRPGRNEIRLQGETAAGKPGSVTFGWDERAPGAVAPSFPPEALEEVFDHDPDLVRAIDETGGDPAVRAAVNLVPRVLTPGAHDQAPLEFVTVKSPGRPASLEIRLTVPPHARTIWISTGVEAERRHQSVRVDLRTGSGWVTVWEKGDTPYPEVFPDDTADVTGMVAPGAPLRVRWTIETADGSGPEVRLVRARIRGFRALSGEVGADA